MSILNCVIYVVFRLKASKGLAIIIFLFSSFHSFTFSTFEIVFLAGIVQLICWSILLGLFCIQFLGLYFRTCPAMFFTSSNKKMFRFTSFCRFSNILRDICLTSLG